MITDRRFLDYHATVTALHDRWKPHPGQIIVGRQLFTHGKCLIFVSCGRKWGKTELIIYILARWGRLHPGVGCWYICPELKQARKLVWTDPRLLNFVPKEWIKKINHSEMRIELTNGSFIQLDGSDNYEAHRGTRPGIVVYEESKDHKRRFREVMRPNMAVYNAPEIHIGTPPSDDDKEEVQQYWDELENEFKNNPDAFYYNAPSWENPHFDTAWGEQEKARLYSRGEGHVWEREYGAKRVKGGVHKIFPMLANKEIALIPHDQLMARIWKDRKKLEWYWWADPAGATCFAVLFAAINTYTRDVYWLDEIYEREQAEMTVKKIGARAIAIRNELNDDKMAWREGYDEAETWFLNEWIENFPNEAGLEPSRKAKSDKDSGLSLMKDIMLAGKWHMSDRCQFFFWELNKYKTNDQGRLPKKDDHLIDDARYILDAAGYSLPEKNEPPRLEPDEKPRGYRISDDFPENDDWGNEGGDWGLE